jgi:hypothetical protein
MSKYEIVFKLGQVNKCLDYEMSPAYRNFGLWDEQITRLYDRRDGLLQELKAYRR